MAKCDPSSNERVKCPIYNGTLTTDKFGQKWLKNIFVFNIDVSILKESMSRTKEIIENVLF